MSLENLVVNRICLHEVHRRSDDGDVVPPTYGDGLLSLRGVAMEAFRSRVIAAFKSIAQCIDMAIRDFGPGSVIDQGVALVAARDPQFVEQSRSIADALAAAQGSRQIPGGLVVVFDGTVGQAARHFFGVMKAELHEGFLKTADLQATYVSDLFLSPKTKLYKIGLFISDGQHPRPGLPDGWYPTVFDSQMTLTHRDSAATYFHSTFLGLNLPENSAQQTKHFYQKTKIFIRNAHLSEEHKVGLLNGLNTYLKVDQGNTVQVGRFADRYMQEDLADDYRAHMRRERFPATAIPKDISEIQGSLRQRRFRFPRQITLSGPPDAVRDLVTVKAVEGDDGAQWTHVTIRGQIESQD